MRQYPPKPEKVYFFGTCLIDMAYPEAGMAAIHLIQREGVEVVFPPDSRRRLVGWRKNSWRYSPSPIR